MWESLAPAITAIRAAGPPTYAATLIGASLFLFLPEGTLTQIGLKEIRDSYRMHLGLAFVGSASLLAVHILQSAYSRLRFRRNAMSKLSTLTMDEKTVLRSFIHGGENTIYASVQDGVIGGLQAKAIIFRASNISMGGISGFQFPYNLQPYARKILTRNPKLLA